MLPKDINFNLLTQKIDGKFLPRKKFKYNSGESK